MYCTWAAIGLRAINVADNWQAVTKHPSGVAAIRAFKCRRASSNANLPWTDQMPMKTFGESCGSTRGEHCPYAEQQESANWICLRHNILLQRSQDNPTILRRGNICLKSDNQQPGTVVAVAAEIVNGEVTATVIGAQQKLVDAAKAKADALLAVERQGAPVSLRARAEAMGLDLDSAYEDARNALQQLNEDVETRQTIRPGTYTASVPVPGSGPKRKPSRRVEVPEYTVAPLQLDFDEEEEDE